MNFTIEEFIESNLSPNAYMLLYSMVHIDDSLYHHIIKNMAIQGVSKDVLHQDILLELQAFGYIKILDDSGWSFRQKALDLQAKINPEVEFDKFWDKYHTVTDQKKSDLQASIKYWKKLTKHEKQKAMDNIEKYYDSLPMYSTGKPVKKARTYLGDKNFNDEFEVIKERRRSLNKMI